MSALRENTARLLLDRVAEDDRARVVQQVAKSLDARSGSADVGFAATLLQLQPNDGARTAILGHLRRLVERGDHAQVAAVCRDHDELRNGVFSNIVALVSSTAKQLNAARRRWIAVPMATANGSKVANGTDEVSDDRIAATIEETTNALHFLSRVISSHNDDTDARSLLEACMILVGAADRRLCAEAQEVLYNIILSPNLSRGIDKAEFWSRIRSLIAYTNASYKTIGFSLWLRWSVSNNGPNASTMKQEEYWSLLVEGLGRGDGERRKAALQILRATVPLALQDSSLVSVIAAGSASDQSESSAPATGILTRVTYYLEAFCAAKASGQEVSQITRKLTCSQLQPQFRASTTASVLSSKLLSLVAI